MKKKFVSMLLAVSMLAGQLSLPVFSEEISFEENSDLFIGQDGEEAVPSDGEVSEDSGEDVIIYDEAEINVDASGSDYEIDPDAETEIEIPPQESGDDFDPEEEIAIGDDTASTEDNVAVDGDAPDEFTITEDEGSISLSAFDEIKVEDPFVSSLSEAATGLVANPTETIDGAVLDAFCADGNDCTILAIKGNFYSQAGDALDRINEIRYEACATGVRDPRDSSKSLTLDDYAPIKWSTSLEKIARTRAVESILAYSLLGSGHNRLNGLDITTVISGGTYISAESLAYNFYTSMTSGIEQWYEEKYDWDNKTGEVTGHYTAMINPNYKYVGLGDFYSSQTKTYPNVLAASFSGNCGSEGQTALPQYTNVLQKIQVSNSYISYAFTNSDDVVMQGDSAEYNVCAKVSGSTGNVVELSPTEDITYASSNPGVATISSSGIVSAISLGTTDITATLDSGIRVSKIITVACKHENSYVTKTEPPTCQKQGTNTLYCPNCKESWDEAIDIIDHIYTWGEEDENGKAEGTCNMCGTKLTIVVPKFSTIYWRNSQSDSQYYYPSLPSSNLVGSTLSYWAYNLTAEVPTEDLDLTEMITEISDTSVLDVSRSRSYLDGGKYGRIVSLSVLKAGIVTLTLYPKYNPNQKKTYTIRLGDTGSVDISDALVTIPEESYIYDGSSIMPTPSVSYNDIPLTRGTDYSVSYKNNIEVGTASLIITGAGIFGGEKTITYTINPIDIKDGNLSLSQTSYEYDTSAKTPSVTLTCGGKTLLKDTDYTVEYSDNTDIGTALVTVEGINHYTGTLTSSFVINHTIHNYADWQRQIEPGCTTQGQDRRDCEYCAEYETRPVAPTGHSYKNAEITYDWTQYGKKCQASALCGVCNHKEEIPLTVTGNTASSQGQPDVITYSAAGTFSDGTKAAAEKIVEDVSKMITDSAFRSAIRSALGLSDTDPIPKEGCQDMTSLDLSGLGISDMSGIEYFTGLESLDCSNNELVALDVSNSPALKTLNCEGNYLTSRDVVTIPEGAAWSDAFDDYGEGLVLGIQRQTIEGPASSYTKTYGNAAFGLNASAQTGLTYSSNNTGVATVSDTGLVTITGGGTARITITAQKTDAFEEATRTISITVNPAAQSISMPHTCYIYTLGKPDFNVNASAKTALTYSVDKPSVISVSSDGTVHMKGAGVAIITINAAATANYKAAVRKLKVYVKPQATSITKIEPVSNGLKLTWNKVAAAEGYAVFRSTDGVNFSFAKKFTTNTTLTFTDTGAASNGVKYYYKVMTYVTDTNGPDSGIKNYYRLSQPALASATNVATRKITATYSRNSSVSGYQVMWSPDAYVTSKVKTITDKTIGSYSITGLSLGTSYYVRVRSYKKADNATYYSAWSSSKKVTIVR